MTINHIENVHPYPLEKPTMRETEIKPTNQTTICTSMAGTKKDR